MSESERNMMETKSLETEETLKLMGIIESDMKKFSMANYG